MTEAQERQTKLDNLLRYGERQGWVISQPDGSFTISKNSPSFFHDRLAKFSDLFQDQTAHEELVEKILDR